MPVLKFVTRTVSTEGGLLRLPVAHSLPGGKLCGKPHNNQEVAYWAWNLSKGAFNYVILKV